MATARQTHPSQTLVSQQAHQKIATFEIERQLHVSQTVAANACWRSRHGDVEGGCFCKSTHVQVDVHV